MNIGWEATLVNGDIIGQGQTPYQDIFLKHLALVEFRLMNRDTGRVLVTVPVETDARVIYRRRREVKTSVRSARSAPPRFLWQVILQKPDYTIAGKNGSVNYQQLCVDEQTGQTERSRHFAGAYMDYPAIYDCEREAGVIPPSRRNDEGHSRG